MELEKLFETLEVEKKNLEKLKSVAEKKQIVLVSSERDQLEELTLKEERLILNVRKDENLRVKQIKEIYDSMGLNVDNPKIALLTDCLNGKVDSAVIEKLQYYEVKIKSLVVEISTVNHRNLFLIEHSRNFITDTINSLIKNKNKSILDKRV